MPDSPSPSMGAFKLTRAQLTSLTIGIGVGAVCLYYVNEQLSTRDVFATLLSAERSMIALALTLNVAAVFFRGLRVKLLAHPLGRLDIGPACRSILHSYTINTLLPVGIGELVRMEYIKREMEIERTEAAALLTGDKLMDAWGLAIFGALGLYTMTLGQDAMHGFVLLLAIIVSGSITLAVMAFLPPNVLTRWLSPLTSRYALTQRVLDVLLTYMSTLNRFSRSKIAILAAPTTLAIWTSNCAALWLYASAVASEVPFSAGIAAMAALGFGGFIPSPPGQLGKYHYLVTFAFVTCGVEEGLAVMGAVIAHGIDTTVFVAMGAVAFAADSGRSLIEMGSSEPEEEDSTRADAMKQ